MNPFAEKYKTLSIAQLLQIIDTPQNYQAAAITAAEDELLGRNISMAEMAEAREENSIHNAEEEAKNEKKRVFGDTVINAASSVIETISPVQKTPASMSRVILLISIWFGITGLIDVYHSASDFVSTWRLHYHLPLSLMLPYFLLGLYLVGTAFLFWKRMKWGWIFLAIFIVYSGSGAICGILLELWRMGLILGAPDNYFPGNYSSVLFIILFYCCCAWFIYKGDVRLIYRIDKHLGLITAAAGFFLTLATFVFALHR